MKCRGSAAVDLVSLLWRVFREATGLDVGGDPENAEIGTVTHVAIVVGDQPLGGPLIDDTWFLVIISLCVGATLLAIILVIGYLKYREKKYTNDIRIEVTESKFC
ncbi:hypothetical protein Avbf_01950 [Armadillidium vulgare]|nr:hypothetical protein Avbf_01950 [Armadillidium vulgare]